jgi:hypothetical protein
MVGGVFLSRPRPYTGCSAWEWVSTNISPITIVNRIHETQNLLSL